MFQSFMDLEVWQNARILKNELYVLVKSFPPDEKFRLADQIVRSVRSINSNIAEGHGRYTFKDQLHFCIQARGSLSETANHMLDAFDCHYISNKDLDYYSEKIEMIRKLLCGYISFLRTKIIN